MSLDNAKNFAKVTVSTGYDDTATSVVLTGGHGALLPTVPFNAVWWNSTDYPDPSDDPNKEIVRVTTVATDTLTVTRNQEGSGASTKNTGGKTYKMIAGLTALNANKTLDKTGDTVTATFGSELMPALTEGNWTVGEGWESPIVGPGLIKNANGIGTQTPSAATSIVAGTIYKVVITLSARSAGSATYTLGGVTGVNRLLAATTYTEYITASTTGNLIITPTSSSRFTISAISVQALTTSTGDLTVEGKLKVGSPSTFYAIVNAPVLNLTDTNGQINFQNNSVVQFGPSGTDIFIGSGSGHAIGNGNIAIGLNVGQAFTTGNSNVFLGYSVGKLTTDGNNNVGMGYDAAAKFVSGNYNVFLGMDAGYSGAGDGFASGSGNTFIGSSSGDLGWTSATNMTCVGTCTGGATNGLTDSIALGANSVITSSNQMVVGQVDTIVIYNKTGSKNAILNVANIATSDKTFTFPNATGLIDITSVFALTDGATPALDAKKGSIFTLSAAGDRTIAIPTNPTDGQKITIRHTASGGARTLALNTGAGGFRYGSDLTGLTETASGKTDYIGAIYNATAGYWDVVAYIKGF